MDWNTWVRQIHCCLSIAFTAAVLLNIVAMVQQQQAVWIGFLALFPLILLMLTGLYLFVRRMPRSGASGDALMRPKQRRADGHWDLGAILEIFNSLPAANRSRRDLGGKREPDP